MCIHRRSFLHSVLQNSCLNRQQRRIKANTVNRTVSWSWSQTAQATRQVLLRLQVKRTRLSGNASSDLKTLLITQPLLPRFTSRRHPNPKSKTTNLADYLFCQTVRQATSKSSQAHPAGASIYLSSSSELDDQDSGALLPGRKPYYIGLQELPASLREFLAEAYAFFTSSHQLERAGQRVSLTTYGKAQERILCEYCLFISLKYDSERNVAQTRVCLRKLE